MKILFYQWHSFMNEGVERAWKQLGIEYDTLFTSRVTGKWMMGSWIFWKRS